MKANSDFKIFNLAISLYNYLRSNIICLIPKVHNDIRIHLLDESYALIRSIISASFTKGNIRNKHITDSLISISMIDTLLSIVLEIENINKKHVITAIGILNNIKNMIYAWKHKEEKIDEEN